MSRILVTGASGLVGSSISRRLTSSGHQVVGLSSKDCDLRDVNQVKETFDRINPQILILAAARVGGVLANSTYPATFLIDNLLMEANVLNWLKDSKNVTQVIFIGSSCIYPLNAPQPLEPDSLMTGPLEPTNRWYAQAKLAAIYGLEGLKIEYGISGTSLLPTNLYGPGDNFHELDGHVLPSLLRRFFEAKLNGLSEVIVWGSGNPQREFLYVDDLSAAIEVLIDKTELDLVYNIGSDYEVTIAELAHLIAKVVGFDGVISFDQSKPDGAPRKHLNIEPIKKLGWNQEISIEAGVKKTFDWLTKNYEQIRKQGVR
jgi:GDP-L-fucose synthase